MMSVKLLSVWLIGLYHSNHVNLNLGHELLPYCQFIIIQKQSLHLNKDLHLIMKFPLNATVLNKMPNSYLLIFLFFSNASNMILEYFVFLLISLRIKSPMEMYRYGNY